MDAEREEGFKHEAFVLEEYSRFRLQQLGVPETDVNNSISQASKCALAREQKKASDSALDDLPHPVRALVRAHPRIHDYLVSRLLISDLTNYSGSRPIPDSLTCVYPQRINRIAKELMLFRCKQPVNPI